MSFSFGNKIITDGLISYLDAANLRSYPGSGTVWNDLTINSNNGSLVNGPVYNSTYGGNITCDGIDDYIQPTGSVTSFTLSMIYQPLVFDTNVGTARYNCVLETDNGGSDKMFLRYNSTNSGGQLLLANHGSAGGELSVTVNHSTGNVYDASITYDDTSKYTALYINGILVGNMTMTSALLYQGTRQLGFTFNCRYYNFKLYNRALSATEVTQNYNALKGRFGL
jgi:hypothetical protein